MEYYMNRCGLNNDCVSRGLNIVCVSSGLNNVSVSCGLSNVCVSSGLNNVCVSRGLSARFGSRVVNPLEYLYYSAPIVSIVV